MKIALVCPASLPATQFGGPLTLFVELARELGKLGNDVTIYTTDMDFANDINTFNRDLPRVEKIDDFKINRTHAWFSLYAFSINPGMYFQIKKDQPDIIHTIGVRSFQSIITALVSKKSKIPLIVTDQAGLITKPDLINGHFIKNMLYKLQTPLVNFVLKQAKKIIVPNEYEEKLFLNYCDKSKLVTIKNGINLETLKSNVDFKKKYNINNPFILFVGRFTKIKGVDTLLKSFHMLKNKSEM